MLSRYEPQSQEAGRENRDYLEMGPYIPQIAAPNDLEKGIWGGVCVVSKVATSIYGSHYRVAYWADFFHQAISWLER